MTSEAQKKLDRLAAFREKERDRKAIETAAAQAKRDGAEEALEETRRALEEEMREVREAVGHPCTREALEMSASCAQSAGRDVGKRSGELNAAEKALAESRKRLLEAHRKVRQMEELAALERSRASKRAGRHEQSELDDLAVVAEVHR